MISISKAPFQKYNCEIVGILFFNSDKSKHYYQAMQSWVVGGGDLCIAWENRFSGRSFNMWLNDNFFHIGRSSKLSSWLDRYLVDTLENGSYSHDTNVAAICKSTIFYRISI